MYDAHAHHILFKKGRGKTQQEMVSKAQRILAENYGIDLIKGKQVLCWAPNRVKGQHSTKTLKALVDDIIEVDKMGGSYDDMVEVLNKHKKQAQERGISCGKKGG